MTDRHAIWLPLCALLVACGDTGQPLVAYPAQVHGAGAGETFAAGAWQVTLDEGAMAIGPMYFCSTEAASMSLCRAAVNELDDVVAFDPLSPSAQPLGPVTGSSGTIRSVTYDVGINWFTRQTSATPASTAPGGHSARFFGHATQGQRSLNFVVDLDITPSFQGTLAIQGTRVGPVTIDENTAQLEIAIDPPAWFARVDFEELAALGGDPVVISQSTRSYNYIASAITLGQPPVFTWSTH